MRCFPKQKSRIEGADVKTPEQLFKAVLVWNQPLPSLRPPKALIAGGILG